MNIVNHVKKWVTEEVKTRVIEYLTKEGLKLRYYDPAQAPEPIKSVASNVDEVLVYQDKGALLFVNERRARTRQQFYLLIPLVELGGFEPPTF